MHIISPYLLPTLHGTSELYSFKAILFLLVLFQLPIYSLNAFKWHKSDIKNLLMKSSEILCIFLPTFYLITWLMTSSKNFEKISILKIWQLVFFWGVKLTSVRNKLNLSLKYWFTEAKKCFLCTSWSPKMIKISSR